MINSINSQKDFSVRKWLYIFSHPRKYIRVRLSWSVVVIRALNDLFMFLCILVKNWRLIFKKIISKRLKCLADGSDFDQNRNDESWYFRVCWMSFTPSTYVYYVLQLELLFLRSFVETFSTFYGQIWSNIVIVNTQYFFTSSLNDVVFILWNGP